MPSHNAIRHSDYFIPNINLYEGNNGTLRFKKYPKFGPILPSNNLRNAVQVTAEPHNYASSPTPVPSVSTPPRAPSPQRPRLFSGAANVKIGAVGGSPSTRRRKSRKSKNKKSRKNRK